MSDPRTAGLDARQVLELARIAFEERQRSQPGAQLPIPGVSGRLPARPEPEATTAGQEPRSRWLARVERCSGIRQDRRAQA